MLIDDYHSQKILARRVRVLAGQLARLAPLNAHLLDVGCGDGQIARLMLEERPDLTITGVDVLLREKTAIPVSLFDGQSLPFPDASEDVVMFVDVLHHTVDPMVMLRESARVSRRWLLLKDHTSEGFAAKATLRFMDWIGNARYGVALPYNYWPERRWHAAFAELGLRPAKMITEVGLYPWWANWFFGRRLHFITLLEKI